MKISSRFRSVAAAVIAAVGISFAGTAHADSGTISFSVYKAAFFVGGSGGEGTKGAQLELSGKQVGLQVNADLSGLAITVK
ncbi:hypothetical protein [Sinorhizobium sp. GL28]|uniref:hypothetical protein n=1 Tax=Sinorhizobium sp. GL28 TaxID=1358418 RepID=UPI00071E5683|nr:hypothetical protein [Sinorhizobium sp. GL28]KSV90999.1 hypothetical protein N184_25120 [Sinorhizobium sp. GL28]